LTRYENKAGLTVAESPALLYKSKNKAAEKAADTIECG
jgi:hypothetical protein